jgi:hypothetical protein
VTKLKQLVAVYEDGSSVGIPLSGLNEEIKESLSKLKLYSAPSFEQPSKSYVLVRWHGGWQEVIGVEKARLEPFRYYVLERVEEIGRMSFGAGEKYPLLLYVRRLPKEIESILILDETGVKMCNLSQKETVTFGERKEHTYYDSEKPGWAFENNGEAHLWVSRLAESLTNALERKQIGVGQALSMSPNERANLYAQISVDLGIQAMENRGDLTEFLDALLRKTQACL